MIMTEIKIKMYRILGYDSDGIPYDITRCLNLDTEQFLNKDIDDITIVNSDKTSSIHVSRQDRMDLIKQAKKDKEETEKLEQNPQSRESEKPPHKPDIDEEILVGENYIE